MTSNQWTHRKAEGGGKRLRLGVGGPSRSGKTYSSLLIASGIAKTLGKPVFVIDTDNEFALDYAGDFDFQHVDFKPPFTSERYIEAIQYCVAQDAGVIVVDQMTAEHTGEGGMLEREEKLEQELSEKWKASRDKVKGAAWAQAKAPHQKFVSYVTRVKQPIIFNFRAKDKIKIVKDPKTGKQEWIHMGYTAICAEQFDFEMTAMLILPANSDGVPDKDLSEIRKPLRPLIQLGQQIDESMGQRLAQWASGATKTATPKVTGLEPSSTGESGANPRPSNAQPSDVAAQKATEVVTITPDEVVALEKRLAESAIKPYSVKKFFNIERFAQLTPAQLVEAHENITVTLAKRIEAQ